MELFEILFILFFIMIPVLNAIGKSRKRRGESDDIQLPGEPRAGRDRPTPARTAPEEESVEAADMVPDDLWEILTGERRERGTPPRQEEPTPEYEAEPELEPVASSEEWTAEPQWNAEEEPWAKERFEPAPWLEDSPLGRRLDVPADQEQTPRVDLYVRESQTARRLRIATQDALAAPRPRRVSPLIETLRRPEGLRQAVLLREILGPPKGLSS